jgi:hypothetical protein
MYPLVAAFSELVPESARAMKKISGGYNLIGGFLPSAGAITAVCEII